MLNQHLVNPLNQLGEATSRIHSTLISVRIVGLRDGLIRKLTQVPGWWFQMLSWWLSIHKHDYLSQLTHIFHWLIFVKDNLKLHRDTAVHPQTTSKLAMEANPSHVMKINRRVCLRKEDHEFQRIIIIYSIRVPRGIWYTACTPMGHSSAKLIFDG